MFTHVVCLLCRSSTGRGTRSWRSGRGFCSRRRGGRRRGAESAQTPPSPGRGTATARPARPRRPRTNHCRPYNSTTNQRPRYGFWSVLCQRTFYCVVLNKYNTAPATFSSWDHALFTPITSVPKRNTQANLRKGRCVGMEGFWELPDQSGRKTCRGEEKADCYIWTQDEERQRQLRERARRLIAEARAGMGEYKSSLI